jgi:hypothetical protein
MPKEQLNTRLDADKYERVENYADERDITQAEAARRLISTGLDAEARDELDPNEIRADLQQINERLDESEQERESDTLRLHARNGPAERFAGGIVAGLLVTVAATTLLGTPVGKLALVAVIGIATYHATTYATRRLLSETDDENGGTPA